ncbi:hypothetical protein L9F63_004731, partial [Diploptera punctata]
PTDFHNNSYFFVFLLLTVQKVLMDDRIRVRFHPITSSFIIEFFKGPKTETSKGWRRCHSTHSVFSFLSNYFTRLLSHFVWGNTIKYFRSSILFLML